MSGTILIGYDVEAGGNPSLTRSFLDTALEVHKQLELPCTFFLLGRVVEENAEELKRFVDHPLFDLQQHTYSHTLLKSVIIEYEDGRQELVRGGTMEQIREDISRGSEVMREKLSIEPIGLCGPWGYYRGLADRPDLLEVLDSLGIKFIRSYGRNHRDYQPVRYSVQPFWYSAQGFPHILEIPIQGWQDYYLRRKLGWEQVDAFTNWVLADMDVVSSNAYVWSYCQHDGSSTADPELRTIRAMAERGRELGIKFMTHKEYYQSLLP